MAGPGAAAAGHGLEARNPARDPAGVRGSALEYEVEVDRRRAIERAIQLAERGDAILIAGKGHEDYQIVAGVKRHFDDREQAAAAMARRAGRAPEAAHA